MATTSLEEKIRILPDELQREVEQYIEFLLIKRHRAELEALAAKNGWPANYFAETAGSITDPTFIRHPQGEFEEREPFE